MDIPQRWILERNRNKREIEKIDNLRKAHQDHVTMLERRIKLLERELEHSENEGMLIHTFLTRRPEVLADYVRHVYSDYCKEWTEGKPALYVSNLDDEYDLSEIPETGDDFKKK